MTCMIAKDLSRSIILFLKRGLFSSYKVGGGEKHSSGHQNKSVHTKLLPDNVVKITMRLYFESVSVLLLKV